MRNLQKILALVLALVMSLSLMATAGATDFTDAEEIDPIFAESVDVLNGLEVFKGYPSGDFQPKGEITRAEVAAIIYRIATGDVSDSQVGIYADYDKFSDVYASEPISGWAAGYINYCANAEYIKGRGDGKFYPAEKVTGYEALAMILRVVGYDKNGEFTGADWQVQTAATANQRKVTRNVNSGMLNQPATRETVAELLCQAILINKVNYTLAFGYQESDKSIAYETFKMECLEGVVTGNEVADLKNTSPMTAGQTRLVVGDEEKVMNFTTGLESIGKSVRAYIRPQNGTTVMKLVPGKVYDTDKNHVYDSFDATTVAAAASSVSLMTNDATEHFVNYDQAQKWTARIRIKYVMDFRATQYDAMLMYHQNGNANNSRLTALANVSENDAGTAPDKYITYPTSVSSAWSTQYTSGATYTYRYVKVIALDEDLTDADYANILSIFRKADKTGNPGAWITGEVYVGTSSVGNNPSSSADISDDIRWEDFIKTYLNSKENRAQVEKNGLGNRLIIIDNDDDGIAEYVLQTKYTIAKITSDLKNVDVINQKLYDSAAAKNDAVNSTTPSNTLVSVSGKELAKTEENTLAVGDVVIYALIDGNIRAQKAEPKTEKVNTVTRDTSITTVGGDTYDESIVHTHSLDSGLKSGVNGMVGNTTYTMYLDLDGNLAAYTEGTNGGLVLITNGWNRSAITGPEYAIQAYMAGENGSALQTVNISTNGARFVSTANSTSSNNAWGNLRTNFGGSNADNTFGSINNQGKQVHTIIANLDGEVLTPVDQAYLYSQQLRMLDMYENAIPGQSNVDVSWATPYETVGRPGNTYPAYNSVDNDDTFSSNRPAANTYEVRSLAGTVYYVVYNAHGTDTMTGGRNVVVRQYSSAPSVAMLGGASAIEDVYAVGSKSTTATGVTYYTAQMVVIEVTGGDYSRLSEQVFIPSFPVIGNNIKIEKIPMIRNGQLVEVDVDMENSDTWDWYFTANEDLAGNSGNRLRGLYYMDPSDTNPDVYVIHRMTPADIRNSGKYLVGFVNESRFGNGGVANDRYTQIETLVRPAVYSTDAVVGTSTTKMKDAPLYVDTYFGTDNATAYNSRPATPASNKLTDQYKTAAITSDSQFYTYDGSTLTASNDYTVLAQYRQDDAGTNVYGLNERLSWTLDSTGAPVYTVNNNPAQNHGNRNEVLVCYNSSGNIVYAVSFNDNTDGNAGSQKVWWNLLPLGAEIVTIDAPTVTFGSKTFKAGSNNVISGEISWAEAANVTSIVVNGGTIDAANTAISADKTSAAAARADAEQVYTGTITGKDGKAYSYTLTQKAKVGATSKLESRDFTNVVVSKEGVSATPYNYQIKVNVTPGNPLSINTVGDILYATNGGKIIGLEAYDSSYILNGNNKGKELTKNQTVTNAKVLEIQYVDADGVSATWVVEVSPETTTWNPTSVVSFEVADSNAKVYVDYGKSTQRELEGKTSSNGRMFAAKQGESVSIVIPGAYTVMCGGTDVDNGGILNGNVKIDKVKNETVATFTVASGSYSGSYGVFNTASVSSVDATITRVELNPVQKDKGARIDTSNLSNGNGTVTVTLPAGTTASSIDTVTNPDGTIGTSTPWNIFYKWFAASNGSDPNMSYTGRFNSFEKASTPDTGCAETWTLNIKGEGTGKDANLKVNFVIGTEKVYEFYYWGGNPTVALATWSGNVNVAVKDLGTDSWLAQTELQALFGDNGSTAPVTMTINNTTVTPTVLRTESKTNEPIAATWFVKLQIANPATTFSDALTSARFASSTIQIAKCDGGLSVAK